MIKGHCFTNLDNYDCSLVNVFASVPRVGDYVVVLYIGLPTRLKVVSVLHDVKDNQPYLKIELHK